MAARRRPHSDCRGRSRRQRSQRHFHEPARCSLRADCYSDGDCFTYADCYTYDGKVVKVINAYTQFIYDKKKRPVDYEAIALSMRKINTIYEGKTIGLPLIGAGLAGGDWSRIKGILNTTLTNMDVWIVHFKK